MSVLLLPSAVPDALACPPWCARPATHDLEQLGPGEIYREHLGAPTALNGLTVRLEQWVWTNPVDGPGSEQAHVEVLSS